VARAFLLLVVFASVLGLSAQEINYRLVADYTIKEIGAGESKSLTIGKVFFDSNFKKLVYKISFPEPETWVITDSVTYQIVDGVCIKKIKNNFPLNFTIFSLCLNGNLENYGLDTPGSFYELSSVDKENDMILSTWLPIGKAKKIFGKVITSTKKKRLFGMAFFNSLDELVQKKVFNKYETIKSVQFPVEILEINYTSSGPLKKITTYRNVIINQEGYDEMYNYPIPN